MVSGDWHVCGNREHQLPRRRIPARDDLGRLLPIVEHRNHRRRGRKRGHHGRLLRRPYRDEDREAGGERRHSRRDSAPAMKPPGQRDDRAIGLGSIKLTLDCWPSRSGRRDRLDRVEQRRKPSGPALDRRSKGRVAAQERLRADELVARQHAKRIFGSEIVRALRVVCGRRSSFQAPAQPLQAASDPALHRSKRHAFARRKLGICHAVEKRRADHAARSLVEFFEASAEPCASSAWLDRLRTRTGAHPRSARPIPFARSRAAAARAGRSALLRAMTASQVIGLAFSASKRRGLLPHRQIDLLQHVFSFRFASEQPDADSVELGRSSLVKREEGFALAARDALEQGDQLASRQTASRAPCRGSSCPHERRTRRKGRAGGRRRAYVTPSNARPPAEARQPRDTGRQSV